MTPHTQGCRLDDGFTLLEVLVAMAIFALAGGALLETFHGGLRDTRLAGEYTRAVILARSRLAEVRAGAAPAPGVVDGRFGPVYAWRVTISDYNVSAAATAENIHIQPLAVTVEVSWESGAKHRSVRLQSLLLGQGP